MQVQESLETMRDSSDASARAVPAGERPAWWVDKNEAGKRGDTPSPLQKAVSRAMRDVVMVRAIDDHVTKQPGMLSFLAGETFAVLGKPTKTYWKGQHKGKIGRFPAAKVALIDDDASLTSNPAALVTSAVSPSADTLAQLSPRSRLEAKTMQFFRVRAIADYLPEHGAGKLRFTDGESFCVLSRDTPDWWKGQHKGRIGRFPRDHVVEIDEAGNEIVPRPALGEVRLDSALSSRALYDDDASNSGASNNGAAPPLPAAAGDSDDGGDDDASSAAAAAAAAAAVASANVTPITTKKPQQLQLHGSPPPHHSPRQASPRQASPRHNDESTSPRPGSAAVGTRVERGSMAHRRARAAVVEAEKKIASTIVDEETANRRLQELQAIVANNEASCVAFKRQIDSLDQEIKSKKVSKKDRERMVSVLDGINVEYAQQLAAQTSLQRQVDEATARADAARFAGVEARRLFETRAAELQRIQEREERRRSALVEPLSHASSGGSSTHTTATNNSNSSKADESSETSSTNAAGDAFESPVATLNARSRSSLSISTVPVAAERTSARESPRQRRDTAPAPAPPAEPLGKRVSSWVRAKVPVEPSAAHVMLASIDVTPPPSQEPPELPPALPPMENVVGNSPPTTLKRSEV